MNPLVLAFLSVIVLSSSLRAQDKSEPSDSLKELKKKYANGGQKPKGPSLPSAAEFPGMPVAELENLLLRDPGCSINPDDAARLAPDLKGKYGLVSCRKEIEGLQVIVLVPKAVWPDQQLAYRGMVGYKLVGGRLIDHYFVIEFDKQKQYLDMLKVEKGVGFQLSGLVVDGQILQFEDVGAFGDALKTYSDIKDPEALAKIAARTLKAANGKRYRVEAHKGVDAWVVIVASDGRFSQVWPKENPSPKGE